MYVFVDITGVDPEDCEAGARLLARAGLGGAAAVLVEAGRKAVALGKFGAERLGGEALAEAERGAMRGVDVLAAWGRSMREGVLAGLVPRPAQKVKLPKKRPWEGGAWGAGARARGRVPVECTLKAEAGAGNSAVVWAAERLVNEGVERWRVGYACGWCGGTGIGRRLSWLKLRRKRMRAEGVLLEEPEGTEKAYLSLKAAAERFADECEGLVYAERIRRVLRPLGPKDNTPPYWRQSSSNGQEAQRAIRRAGKTVEEVEKLMIEN